jgi:hypothetical protein
MVWMTISWMRHNTAGVRIIAILNLIVVLAMAITAYWAWRGPLARGDGLGVFGAWDVALVFVTLGIAVAIHRNIERTGPPAAAVLGPWWKRLALWLVARGEPQIEQARAALATQWFTRLFTMFVFSAVTLAFAGFAHELIITVPGNLRRGHIENWKDAITALVALVTAAGSLFTAFKAAPTGGRDAREVPPPSMMTRVIFAITPVLVLVLLAALGAWCTHRLLMSTLRPDTSRLPAVEIAAAIGLVLALVFAFWENQSITDDSKRLPWAYPVATLIILLLMTRAEVVGLGAWGPLPSDDSGRVRAVIGLLLLAALVGFASRTKRVRFLLGFVAGVGTAEAIVRSDVFSDFWRAGDYSVDVRPEALLVGIALVGALGSWVIALGWMADPNALSLHTFYKVRLVRAYLGASNAARHGYRRRITETEAGDDLPLSQVQTWRQGGPYLLVNTTLNLVGGHDLATAQRSAAHFLLSSAYCGSERTRYRETDRYMRGALTLGAAVAASGAAVSPNMGSVTPSAAMSLLLAFLNVRLGLWVPTPDRGNWAVPQTRLWPVLLLAESLSQTTDVSSSCYLSDGGHFDNTGLYPLIARGCRLVILIDNGADANRCFADLGVAIRRCRIDFGAEISLDPSTFRAADGGLPTGHVVVGTIEYAPAHLRDLGWSDSDQEDKNTGKIVWIKPAVLPGDPAADVRQYQWQHPNFPQQSTVNQWFDESQFESYRMLGELSAEAAFAEHAALVAPLSAATIGKLVDKL